MSQILFSEYFDSLYWVWLGWNQISPQQPSHCRALVLYFWSWKVTDNTPACWLSTAPTAPVLSLHHSLPYQWAGDGKDTPSMWGDTVRTAGSGWPKGYSMWYDMCSAIKEKGREGGHSLFMKFVFWSNQYKPCSCGIAGHHLLLGRGDEIFCFPLLLCEVFAFPFALLNSFYWDPWPFSQFVFFPRPCHPAEEKGDSAACWAGGVQPTTLTDIYIVNNGHQTNLMSPITGSSTAGKLYVSCMLSLQEQRNQNAQENDESVFCCRQ